MFRILLSYIIIIVLLSLYSCSNKQATTDNRIISVIPKGTTHVFWKSIQAGAIKAGIESNVTINWIGPEKEDDRQEQIALLDNQVMNEVSGIILSPIDDTALRRPVHAAVKKGIPVIIIDSGLKDSQEIYTSFIATNNYLGGQIAGQELGKLMGGEGRVLVLRFVEGSASTEERAKGFLEAINKYDKINLISDDQYGGATQSQAQQVAENILLRFLDNSGNVNIDGIFCTNESTTYGMLQALRRKRLTGKIKFIGFDGSPALIDGVSNKEIHGLVVQNPFKMGYLSVKTMVAHLDGRKVDKNINTEVTYVNIENINAPDIREIIFPELEKWLGK